MAITRILTTLIGGTINRARERGLTPSTVNTRRPYPSGTTSLTYDMFMRILYLGINYWPEDTGIGAFASGRCEYLASCGHEVTSCTGFPYYPQWQVPGSYRHRIGSIEYRNGVRVVRSWLYVPRKVTSAKRILHEASFLATNLLAAARGPRPDLIVVTTPPLGLGLTGHILGRMWKVPYVLLVEDLQPDAAIDLGMIKPGGLANALFALERLAYRHAALVSTLTNGMAERIVAKGVPSSKVRVIPHWIDEALLDLPAQPKALSPWDEFAEKGKFLVVHAGNMGIKQGLDVMLEAAALSQDHVDITYLMVGDGVEAGRLKAQAEARRLTNLRFFSLQPRPAFENLLSLTGVGLVTQQSCVSDIVFPSKVETLLAAGRPVIASVNPSSEVARAIRDAAAGLVVGPGDAKSLVEAVLTLRSNPGNAQSMGQSGRAYARDRWNRQTNLGLLESTLNAVNQISSTDEAVSSDETASPMVTG
jgi:colanic acid biosynthesis glycosyl transferase WcaI